MDEQQHQPLSSGMVASVTTLSADGDKTIVEAKSRHTATLARAAVTITAIIAATVVSLLKPEQAPVFSSVAVGAISGFFAISRNSDQNTTT